MRTTAVILSVIPYRLITVMRLVFPGMVEPMFSTFGRILVFLFIVGIVVRGNIVINRMVTKTLEYYFFCSCSRFLFPVPLCVI